MSPEEVQSFVISMFVFRVLVSLHAYQYVCPLTYRVSKTTCPKFANFYARCF